MKTIGSVLVQFVVGIAVLMNVDSIGLMVTSLFILSFGISLQITSVILQEEK